MNDLVRRAVEKARPTLAASYSQSAAAGAGGAVSGVHQEMNLVLEVPELYLHLRAFELRADGAETPLAPGAALRAGMRYRVRVAASVNRHGSFGGEGGAAVEQFGIRPGRPLLPVPRAGPGLSVGLPPVGPVPLTRDGWEGWSYAFEVGVPAEADEETGLISLDLGEEGTAVIHEAVRLSVRVEGASARPPSAMRPWLPLGERPPAGTAFLHVVPHDDERVRFLGWLAEPVHPELGDLPVRRPRFQPGTADGAAYRVALAEGMNDFASGDGGALAAWLAAVLEACDDCCLVVVDQDPWQSPWELVKLPGRRILGAQLQVVRWADLQYRHERLRVPLDEVTYAGRLAALVTDDGRPWLDRFAPGGTSADGEGLVSSLLDLPDPVGAVYLSSRGLLVHGDEDLEALERLPGANVQTRVRLDDLEDAIEPRPLVFSDAPFSGRLLFCRGAGCGLARAAMLWLASGYVGTLGPVDRDYALEVARLFFERAAREEGVRPAELLRELRVAEAEAFRAASTGAERRSAKERLLNASMFVYYGSPRATVRILGAAGGGDG